MLILYKMLNTIQKRFLLFLIGCIGVRTMFVYVAKTAQPKILQLLGLIALLPAFGFFYIFLSGSRKTGGEVFGNKIWWNSLRPIHGLLYALFAYFAITKNKNAWQFLAVDVIIGLIAFIFYHTFNNNLSILFNFNSL